MNKSSLTSMFELVKKAEKRQRELEAENKRLREALDWFVTEYERGERQGYDAKITPRMFELAQAALKKPEVKA